jgi:hypothetical protein
MLAEILANPVAWPLWAVFLFAATMYPIGLLMPGCVCCGTSGCTECGVLTTGYVDPQNAHGRMCCTGTLANSITVRITNVGGATSQTVVRGAGSPYSKTTKTYDCSALAGDYVITKYRFATVPGTFSCGWSGGDSEILSQFIFATVASGAFPNWKGALQANFGYRLVTTRNQTCTGFPGVESCNVGTTSTGYQEEYLDDGAGSIPGTPTVAGGVNTVQNCAGVGAISIASATVYSSGVDTGCRVSVEIVA